MLLILNPDCYKQKYSQSSTLGCQQLVPLQLSNFNLAR